MTFKDVHVGRFYKRHCRSETFLVVKTGQSIFYIVYDGNCELRQSNILRTSASHFLRFIDEDVTPAIKKKPDFTEKKLNIFDWIKI